MVTKRKKSKSRKGADRVTDFDIAFAIHTSRSQHAQDVDNGTSARLTTNLGLYAHDPSRFDFLGVDTPKNRREPKQFNRKSSLAKARKMGFI